MEFFFFLVCLEILGNDVYISALQGDRGKGNSRSADIGNSQVWLAGSLPLKPAYSRESVAGVSGTESKMSCFGTEKQST
jgi:hypothetical protein